MACRVHPYSCVSNETQKRDVTQTRTSQRHTVERITGMNHELAYAVGYSEAMLKGIIKTLDAGDTEFARQLCEITLDKLRATHSHDTNPTDETSNT